MIENNSNSTQDHQLYSELCALATTGTLSDREWQELKSHLVDCADCGKLVQEYREIARTGMAMLMPDNAAIDKPANEQIDAEKSWTPELAKTELLARIAREEIAPQCRLSRTESRPALTTFWRELWNPRFRLMPRYALALVVIALIAGSAYRLGTRQTREFAKVQAQSSTIEAASLRVELNQLMSERAALDHDAQQRSAELRTASEQLQFQADEVQRWKSIQGTTAEELRQRIAELGTLQAHQVSADNDRDAISRRLQDSQTALHTVQQKYDSLREQHAAQLLRTASLETRIDDLSARLKQSESTVEQHQQFLASDRDIRELMGARELYIADVFDVDQNGKTQKPFGRAFYTQGKSLIFYAFDLDQQPHLRNASTFQAWGRRGLSDKRPLNMGIFYLDNETNKRWALKFDDPEALAQVDAVFVTVEPHGGSQKPSGKQLLFASLRSIPNHP